MYSAFHPDPMASVSKGLGNRLVLSPQEPIVGGGAAEAFERHLQKLFRSGYRDLIVDMRGVAALDSAGVRALVRGHTSAQRVEGSLRIAGLAPKVRQVLELSRLGEVLEVYESVDAARFASWPWRTVRVWVSIVALTITLVAIGLRWPNELSGAAESATTILPPGGTAPAPPLPHRFQPFIELIKLIAAAMIGQLVTSIHQPSPRERPLARSMEQAQTLLCVSGAMMMIIIGNNVARAFGIAGAASIIRFRTPVDDPKDVTILFLLMSLGMATGLGQFAVAGLGTAFLCVALLTVDRFAARNMRIMSVEILASGRQFPTTHVEEVFARNQIVFEPREISQSDDVTVKYLTWLDPKASLDELSSQLMASDAGVQSVSWEHPKRA
jgi:anti-anti-sigma factor